jgi:ankyrin repeat protein
MCACTFFFRLLFFWPTSCFNNRVISSSSLVLLLYSEIFLSSGEWLTDDGSVTDVRDCFKQTPLMLSSVAIGAVLSGSGVLQ